MFKVIVKYVCVMLMLTAPMLSYGANNEALIKQKIMKFIGAPNNVPLIKSVTKLPYGDMYEVVLQSNQIIYTNHNVNYLLDGQLIDVASKKNLTEEKLNKLSTIDFSQLPLTHAIKEVKGNGKRILVSFEDPNCHFCKRLTPELEKLDNVTIYTFLLPILGPDSLDKANYIWCANKPLQAWKDWMKDDKEPTKVQCAQANIIHQNMQLGQQLNITGTPTMFLSDGTRLGGYMSSDDIEKALSSIR